MNTTADLKLMGVALVDGRPLACGACGNTFSLEVHKAGPFETGRAWVCCLSCGHGEDSTDVTNGLVDAVLTDRADRIKAADRDVFAAEWRGTVLSGELLPLLDGYEAARVARGVYEGATPHVKAWWRGKKRRAVDRAKAPFRAAKDRAGQAVGEGAAAAKAAALSAAWTMQTGGAGPTTRSRSQRRRCTVKGCRKGWVTIRTRVHSSTGGAKDVRIPCAVCRRSES